MDLCQSPTGGGPLEPEDNTLERASYQDEILGTGGATSKEARKRKQRIVSDFDPGPIPSADEAPFQGQSDIQDSLAAQPLKLKMQEKAPEKDDSFRRVGFFLEKIKERNSSLQERLNLSFKKSSRLDQSSISYRPTTSFAYKKTLKGAFIERECISLTRDHLEGGPSKRDAGANSESSHGFVPPQQSKTPNLLNQQSSAIGPDLKESDSQNRLLNWDGMKPQLVRQMPAHAP